MSRLHQFCQSDHYSYEWHTIYTFAIPVSPSALTIFLFSTVKRKFNCFVVFHFKQLCANVGNTISTFRDIKNRKANVGAQNPNKVEVQT